MRQFVAGAIFLFVCNFATFSQQTEEWKMFGSLTEMHVYGQIVKLNTSQALYVGGYTDALWEPGSRAVDLFSTDGSVATITPMPQMPEGLAEMPVIAIDESRCVVVGGFNENGLASKSVYEFNLGTRTWRKLGNLNAGRRQHAAYRLSQDEIVVVGGRSSDLTTLASAEIFSLATGRSRSIASFPSPINGSVYGLMSDGRGVICGGRDGGPNDGRIPGIYSYVVSENRWKALGGLPSGREAPFAMRVRSGQFIVIGGSLSESPVNFIGECILEENGAFRTFGEIPYGAVYAGLSERGDNRVLVVGGWLSDLSSTAACTYIDVSTGAIAAGPSLNVARRYVRSVTLEGPLGSGLQTFAISGVSNSRSEKSVEILETKCLDNVNVVLPGARIVGSAAQTPSGIQLTSSAKYQAGAAWLRDRLQVASGFDVRFSFRMKDGNDNGQIDDGPQGADGIVFVIQNESRNPLGKPGDGIGYNELPHGLAVEFDAYLNAAFTDPSGSHIAVQVGDGMILRPWHVAPYLKGITSEGFPPFVADGATYYARVQLVGKTLSVYCSKSRELNTPALVVEDIDIAKILALRSDGAAYLGFTSSTGFSSQTHELLSVQVEGCAGLISDVDDNDEELPSITSMSVAPTPASELATLSIPLAISSDISCTIVDMIGHSIRNFVLPAGSQTVAVPIGGLSNGVYRVLVNDAKGVYSVPLVISR